MQILGTAVHPGEVFMKQMASLLTDPVDGLLRAKHFLILDRDGIFSPAFLDALRSDGIRPIQTPAQAPDCNAYAERFVRSIKHECLNHMIFFGIGSLDRATAQYAAHYNSERNHQGIGNELIAPTSSVGDSNGRLVRTERLGGMLNYYSRRAA